MNTQDIDISRQITLNRLQDQVRKKGKGYKDYLTQPCMQGMEITDRTTGKVMQKETEALGMLQDLHRAEKVILSTLLDESKV